MKNEQTEEIAIPEDEFFGAVNEKSIEDEVMEEDEWLSLQEAGVKCRLSVLMCAAHRQATTLMTLLCMAVGLGL